MIVPMKKISLIILGDQKEQTLKKLRKLGMVHVEIREGSGERLTALREQVASLERGLFTLGKKKKVLQKPLSPSEALTLVAEISALEEEQKQRRAEKIALTEELARLKGWGPVDPRPLWELEEKGIQISFYEMPKADYQALPEDLKTVPLEFGKSSVKFLLCRSGSHKSPDKTVDTVPDKAVGTVPDKAVGTVPDKAWESQLKGFRLTLPRQSTDEMEQQVARLSQRIQEISQRIASYICYVDGIKDAIASLEKEIEFETYAAGMAEQRLSPARNPGVSVAYFVGYTEAENVDRLRQAAARNSWGLLVEDPGEEDNVPTKLKNNKLVSLIYPLTDFLGTVPGYFEYDISGWFLAFILVFFGIIFGDGGYGLLVCAIAALPILKALITKRTVSPTFLLVGLFGLSTVLWGTLTCTWFGLSPDQLPQWLKSLSIPVISNVYGDKIWYPFWTEGAAGLTTAQNLQIFCFSLALIQLTVAHVKGMVRNRRSLKLLGDLGSILQLFGIYYLVLSLVVNPQVFSFGLVIGGVPVGTVALGLIGVGFFLSFVFSNYEGSIIKSILSSLTNIVSVLLGVVNVFSDIVSYIRLWAVGLAGAAISATVNELAGPLLGNFMFMILAIVLLVFGHGLNMVLNVLSVIVHGIRLNTLEFSSHLDMSWSGHKFKPFKE